MVYRVQGWAKLSLHFGHSSRKIHVNKCIPRSSSMGMNTQPEIIEGGGCPHEVLLETGMSKDCQVGELQAGEA